MQELEERPLPQTTIPPAAELRARVQALAAARAEHAEAKRRRLGAERRAELDALLNERVKPRDIERAQMAIERAVANGLLEVEITRFPAHLLTDRGRAINNHDPDWPTTLRGHPAECFSIFEAGWAPLGYRMHARVLAYPGGMPGEIGLYLSWA